MDNVSVKLGRYCRATDGYEHSSETCWLTYNNALDILKKTHGKYNVAEFSTDPEPQQFKTIYSLLGSY
jgi:hypothetical protein